MYDLEVNLACIAGSRYILRQLISKMYDQKGCVTMTSGKQKRDAAHDCVLMCAIFDGKHK